MVITAQITQTNEYRQNMARLLVNIDHVATLRNARGEGYPSVLEAAKICLRNGAAGIVFHLREDRRHIKDEDVAAFKGELDTLLDFEMAATDEMISICAEMKPYLSTLVPESREELTTEGGLNLRADGVFRKIKRAKMKLDEAEVPISLFLDPVTEDIEKAAELGVFAVELHTGNYANAKNAEEQETELKRLEEAAKLIHSKGMKVHAGHGLNFENTEELLKRLPDLHEVSIGHALISHALFHGLGNSVKKMSDLVERYG